MFRKLFWTTLVVVSLGSSCQGPIDSPSEIATSRVAVEVNAAYFPCDGTPVPTFPIARMPDVKNVYFPLETTSFFGKAYQAVLSPYPNPLVTANGFQASFASGSGSGFNGSFRSSPVVGKTYTGTTGSLYAEFRIDPR